MKKTKYWALVLVVAVMMMGAGYAYWTDTLVVDTNVKTGSLDVDFTEFQLMHISPEVDAQVWIDPLGDNADNGNDWDKAVIRITNLYPMAEVRHQFTAENKGSIAVQLDTVELIRTGDEVLGLEMEIMEIVNNQAVIIPEGKFTDGRTLAPGETMVLDVAFRLSADAPNETTENKEAKFEMKLQYKQDYPVSATPAP